MLQYLRCIEVRGVQNVGVGLWVFRDEVVKKTETFTVNRRATRVCRKRFLNYDACEKYANRKDCNENT